MRKLEVIGLEISQEAVNAAMKTKHAFGKVKCISSVASLFDYVPQKPKQGVVVRNNDLHRKRSMANN